MSVCSGISSVSATPHRRLALRAPRHARASRAASVPSASASGVQPCCAHRQPHRPEAVLQQPVHHVALGEHLRLAGDLVRLDLAAGVELGVERPRAPGRSSTGRPSRGSCRRSSTRRGPAGRAPRPRGAACPPGPAPGVRGDARRSRTGPAGPGPAPRGASWSRVSPSRGHTSRTRTPSLRAARRCFSISSISALTSSSRPSSRLRRPRSTRRDDGLRPPR
jgi:hypothetical protein